MTIAILHIVQALFCRIVIYIILSGVRYITVTLLYPSF